MTTASREQILNSDNSPTRGIRSLLGVTPLAAGLVGKRLFRPCSVSTNSSLIIDRLHIRTYLADVWTLSITKGIGVECVIAQSFAFIYSRNQPSLGLWGITIKEPRFYELAETGAAIEIDLDANEVRIGGESFSFALSKMEKSLTRLGGMTSAFNKFGKRVYDVLTAGSSARPRARTAKLPNKADKLAW